MACIADSTQAGHVNHRDPSSRLESTGSSALNGDRSTPMTSVASSSSSMEFVEDCISYVSNATTSMSGNADLNDVTDPADLVLDEDSSNGLFAESDGEVSNRS